MAQSSSFIYSPCRKIPIVIFNQKNRNTSLRPSRRCRNWIIDPFNTRYIFWEIFQTEFRWNQVNQCTPLTPRFGSAPWLTDLLNFGQTVHVDQESLESKGDHKVHCRCDELNFAECDLTARGMSSRISTLWYILKQGRAAELQRLMSHVSHFYLVMCPNILFYQLAVVLKWSNHTSVVYLDEPDYEWVLSVNNLTM